MSIVQAIIFGFIQGITEIIPISSFGHLILISELFDWGKPEIIFKTFLSLGTILATAVYFRREWYRIGKNIFTRPKKARTAIILLIAILPSFILGFFLNDYFSIIFRHPIWTATFLIVVGFIFFSAEKYSDHRLIKQKLAKISRGDALIVGLVQIITLLPGVPRLGITIATGMFRSLKRKEAAFLSFSLGITTIIGVNLPNLLKITASSEYLKNYWPEIASGTIISAIVGYASLKYLMKFLSRHRLNIFAFYLVALGTIIFLTQWIY